MKSALEEETTMIDPGEGTLMIDQEEVLKKGQGVQSLKKDLAEQERLQFLTGMMNSDVPRGVMIKKITSNLLPLKKRHYFYPCVRMHNEVF